MYNTQKGRALRDVSNYCVEMTKNIMLIIQKGIINL